jgi:hypothetical protein
VQDAAEPFVPTYVDAGDLRRIGEGCGQRAQCGGVRDALMGPMAFVEPSELPQDVEQMALVPDSGSGPAARGGRPVPTSP